MDFAILSKAVSNSKSWFVVTHVGYHMILSSVGKLVNSQHARRTYSQELYRSPYSFGSSKFFLIGYVIVKHARTNNRENERMANNRIL